VAALKTATYAFLLRFLAEANYIALDAAQWVNALITVSIMAL